MSRGDDQMMIRIPAGMRGRIKAAAAAAKRSANAEIVFHLERIFPAPNATTGGSLQADTPAVALNPTALAGGENINPADRSRR